MSNSNVKLQKFTRLTVENVTDVKSITQFVAFVKEILNNPKNKQYSL